MKFRYGDEVKDKLTGFRGRITGFVSYYDKRPNQYLVEAIDTTGRPIECWCEEERLELD